MGETTKIEWADATFNPWIGCTRVSPGCVNCYAETLMDKRYGRVRWGPGQPRSRTSVSNWRQPVAWNRTAERARRFWAQCGAVGSPPARPRVFCASLADWLDHEVPTVWRADLLALIRSTPDLDWLLLTKRPESWSARLHEALGVALPGEEGFGTWIGSWLDGEAPTNVWVGTTVEDQERADLRVPQLLEIPARVRFLSCEPLLGPVNLNIAAAMSAKWWPDDRCFARKDDGTPVGQAAGLLDWVIAGGESGHGARPSHPDWLRSLRDQCVEAGVAFHFKQHGKHVPRGPLGSGWQASLGARAVTAHGYVFERVGKVAAGRELDGRTWDEVPRG